MNASGGTPAIRRWGHLGSWKARHPSTGNAENRQVLPEIAPPYSEAGISVLGMVKLRRAACLRMSCGRTSQSVTFLVVAAKRSRFAVAFNGTSVRAGAGPAPAAGGAAGLLFDLALR